MIKVVLFESKVFTMNNTNADPKELERLYEQYFNQEESLDIADESISLLQPSPSECVDSFTTNSIIDDLLVNKEK